MIRTKVAALVVGATMASAGLVMAAGPAGASSGVKCTNTAHTGTCIEIIGDGLYTQEITSSHHNDNPNSKGGYFILTGPGMNPVRSPYITYKGDDVYWSIFPNKNEVPGTYYTQFYVGTGTTPQSGKASAMIHA